MVVVAVKEEDDEVDKAALLPRGMRSAKCGLVPKQASQAPSTVDRGARNKVPASASNLKIGSDLTYEWSVQGQGTLAKSLLWLTCCTALWRHALMNDIVC
jgi:hypothetical protein